MRVLVSGAFELLHVGHIRLLARAASLGEVVVAVKEDSIVRLERGENRPYVELAERVELLSALRHVEEVLTFGEAEPISLFRNIRSDRDLRPGIVMMGKEHQPKRGGRSDYHDVIRDSGCRLEFFPMVPDRLTTRVYRQFLHAEKRSTR